MSFPPLRRSTERAAGLLSAAIGIAVVMGFLGLLVNVSLGLWTRSTIDSIAYDAAREVATRPSGVSREDAAARALSSARSVLGPIADDVELHFEWGGMGSSDVALRVRSPGVALLPRLIDGGPTVGAIDRRIVVVEEQP